MVDIPINTQRNPVGYLARKFAINYNLPKAALLAGTTPVNVPNLTSQQALALATFALLRLRTAQLAQTDDVAGAWDTEAAAAATFADKALAEVSASHPGYFPTAQRVFAKLEKYADDHNTGSIPAPGNLAADWATNKGAVPIASPQVLSQANHLAIDINLLSGVTNAESTTETLKVVSVAGKNWQLNRKITIAGIEYTMAASYHLTASAPGVAAPATTVPVVITDSVAATNLTRNLTITITNTAPTASAITTTVANNTAISKNFLTLSSSADANADTLRVVEINGVPVPDPFTAGNYQFTVSGKVFTLAKATGLVTAAAQTATATWTGTFKIGDNDPVDPKQTAATNWSIQNLA